MATPTPISDLNACIARLVVHATAAGATLTTPITDVARGVAVPVGRCGRVWYGGEADPTAMGGSRVMNGELVGEIVHITFFWPMQGASGSSIAADVDKDVIAIKHQLRTRILGDSTLAGTCTDLVLEHMTADLFDLIDGTQWRTLEAAVNLSYAEYVTNA